MMSIIRAFCDPFPDCSLWTGIGLDWMLVGTRDARFGRSEVHFTRQWNDPAVAPELRALGFELPAQLGATFLMDAADLDSLTAGVLPLTDDHPKRLSSGGFDKVHAWATFGPWLDTDTARGRFADSEFVRRLWPERLRRETLAYFEFQRIINALAAPSLLRPADWRRDLHRVIATGRLESLALWLMGGNADELLALDRLESQGRSTRKHVHRRAVQALAERDFELASRLFARARLQFPKDRSLVYFELYALRRAGRFAEARALTRGETSENRLARSEWLWMDEHLDPAGPSPGGE